MQGENWVREVRIVVRSKCMNVRGFFDDRLLKLGLPFRSREFESERSELCLRADGEGKVFDEEHADAALPVGDWPLKDRFRIEFVCD